MQKTGNFKERNMKKVILKTHLVPALCLMLFVSFIQAQTNSNEPAEESEPASIETKPARRESRLQPQLQIKKWGRLREGMTEKQTRYILGKPNLIQGSSHKCTWFYQHLPNPNAEEKVNGTVTFKAKTPEQLLEEEKTEHIKNVEKLNETYQTKLRSEHRDLRICDEKSKKCYYFYRIGDGTPYYYSYEVGYTPLRYSLPEISVSRREADDRQAMLKKALKFEGQFKKFVDDYERAVKRLADGYGPRSPVFQLVSFNPPDSQIEYSSIRENACTITAQDANDKWHLPRNWRQLKINMTVNQVHRLLGQPEKSEANAQNRKEFYGDVSGYGELCFSARSGRNREERLDSWTEPFWPMVKMSLNTKSQADTK